MAREYGDNLNWFLSEVESAGKSQIDHGVHTVYGVDPEGREGHCDIDLRELCGAALARILALEGSHVYEVLVDEQGIPWPKCRITGCDKHCCQSLESPMCYQHTLGIDDSTMRMVYKHNIQQG